MSSLFCNWERGMMMAREGRKHSAIQCYHIVLQGIKGILLFEKDWEQREFEYILDEKLEETPEVMLEYFCIKKDHFHGILYGEMRDISRFCSKVMVSYVWAYNERYRREGGLFQKRFLSEPIQSKVQLEQVLLYLKQHSLENNWRINSKIEMKHWIELLYYCPIVLDCSKDMKRQKITIAKRVIKDWLQEHQKSTVFEIEEKELFLHLIQKKIRKLLGITIKIEWNGNSLQLG